MRIKNTEIKVVLGDITELRADAIVNAANNKLIMGGGVAGVIKRKGGRVIEEEVAKKGPIEIGQAIATGGGELAVKYVIHAATMGMDFKTDEIKIRNACKNSLNLARELKISSIVFPALGCGTGGFPLLASAKIMAQEVLKHLREADTTLKEITFCLYDQEAFTVFTKNVLGYLEYVTTKLANGPYVTVDAIIELAQGIVIIQRSNPPFGWALPGGFVDYGESLEDAVKREAKEETNLDLIEIKQFHTYSDPQRDPRFHTVGTVFTAKAKGKPKAGDDAASLKVVKLNELAKLKFAFDHKKIISDYLISLRGAVSRR
jgi:O-acetyl-ADP-ribose deacetylase (regulator of RNase III)/ADP-ribose pyrophosphatase YjhB (NUDIX family)